MELKDLVYEYTEKVRRFPELQYGSDTEPYYRRWKDEIIGYRPPKKGDRVVSWLTGKDEIALHDFEEGNCRFILCPKPKVLRKYTVTVYDEEPRDGGLVTKLSDDPVDKNSLTQSVWRKDGWAYPYRNGYRRCEVKEEEV